MAGVAFGASVQPVRVLGKCGGYDSDIADAIVWASGGSVSGVPANAVNLKRMIGAHHGVLIVSPEYNSSVPPLLKNAIDWVTRVRDRDETFGQVFRERAFAIAAASDGKFGGLRVLMALRQILALGCGATVIPKQVTLSFADQAFDEMDRLRHPADAGLLKATLRQLIATAQQTTM